MSSQDIVFGKQHCRSSRFTAEQVAERLDKSDKVSYAFNKSNVFVNYREGEAYPPQHPEGFVSDGGAR